MVMMTHDSSDPSYTSGSRLLELFCLTACPCEPSGVQGCLLSWGAAWYRRACISWVKACSAAEKGTAHNGNHKYDSKMKTVKKRSTRSSSLGQGVQSDEIPLLTDVNQKAVHFCTQLHIELQEETMYGS